VREVASIGDALKNARTLLSRRMDHQKLLSRELSHRLKNAFGVVQAIVSRSIVDSRPVEVSRELAMQRISALARAQDLLTSSTLDEVTLRELVDLELSPFGARVNVEGPAIVVGSSQIQSFALLLHELVTNAVKHGALHAPDGTLTVRWNVEGQPGQEHFHFEWIERCRPVTRTLGGGFGNTLLRTVFKGPETTIRLEIEPDGLCYELTMPLSILTEVAD
jgi:two-component sensor histidine kinase